MFLIDLAALAGLFFEPSKEWREPKVAVWTDLKKDIADEPAVKDGRASA
jgi:hypothetical protein